jgi:hypothetical protein
MFDHGEYPGGHGIDDCLCGIFIGYAIGHRYDALCRDRDQLTPGAPHVYQHDARARSRTCNVRSERLHRPDALNTGARRRRGLTPETSTEHVKVGGVNGRKTYAHKNLSRPRHRIRQIAKT